MFLFYSLFGFLAGILLTLLFTHKKTTSLLQEKVALQTKLENQTSLETITKDFSEKILKDLHKESEDFFSKKSANIESLLSPMKESLSFFQQNLKLFETKQAEDYGCLKEQINQLLSINTTLKTETHSLTAILKHPGNRGRWGELQLERLLEISGMLKYCDFSSQTVGKSGRPDTIVQLPKGRCIIIDAKFPLSEEYFCTDSKAEKTDLLQKMKVHIKSLKSKNYTSDFPHTPEFVVLFLPSESIFYDILQLSARIFEDAANDNIIICTPSNLLALLKTVAYIWKQDNLREQIQTIGELGKTLHDRFITIMTNVSALGKLLDRSVSEYNLIIKNVNKHLIPTLNKFEDITVQTHTEELPNIDSTPHIETIHA